MLVWRVHQLGEPIDVLQLDVVDDPSPGPGQLLIDVAACGLNFPDVLLCQGRYQVKPPFPFTPGQEVAGTIAAIGTGVEGWSVGQRVVAMTNAGLAQRAVVAAATTFAVPDTLDDVAGAGIPITYGTGYFGLVSRAQLRAGETLLVHAGAGGVGSAAIQIGKAIGATVFATAGGPAKAQVCRDLGADIAIDYLAEDFVEIVKQATRGAGADVIYDPVGGDIFDRSRKCIAWDGRILPVGFTSGRIADAPTNHVLLKNYSVVGVHWGASLARPGGIAAVQSAHTQLMAWHTDGFVQPLVGGTIPFTEAPRGLVSLADRSSVGKLVVVAG